LRFAFALLLEKDKYDLALKVAQEWVKRVEALPADTEERARKILDAKEAAITVLFMNDKKKRALVQSQELVKFSPENPRALNLLRSALSYVGRDDESLEVARKVYKLDPDDPGINNDLGYSWADKGINLDQAEAMIRKALTLKPNVAAFQDSLGWVLYKKGRFSEARTIFQQLLTHNDGKHPVMFDHAGDVCWRLGLEFEAIRLWSRALKEAKDERNPQPDTEKMIPLAEQKIKEAKRHGKPPIAPLGEGISAEQ
jgi:Flp pilus assembly protein TadD